MPKENPPDLPLLDFFRDYFRPLFLRGRSPKTIALYLISVRSLCKFLGRPPRLSDLCDTTINRYLSYFRDLPRRPSTVNKERANLLAMWRFACRKNYLEIWPDVPKDVEPEMIPIAWMRDELEKLFAQAAKMPGFIGSIPAARWWVAILLVCWDTGERISAILNLRWKDVDLNRGWIVAPADSRKGGRADEAYELHADTIGALRAIHQAHAGRVFPWPHHPTYIWQRYARLLKLAGLPHDRKSKFHRIRKSVGSYVKAAGGDPTEALRHRDSRSTKAYLDPRIVKPAQAISWLFRPGTPGGDPPCPAA
jgi:integrase